VAGVAVGNVKPSSQYKTHKDHKLPIRAACAVLFHASTRDENSPVPFDHLKKVHISLAEGMEMGVSSKRMMKY
jgi:hypothetical protein